MSTSAADRTRVGNFLSFTGLRTDRFLDPPELQAIHDPATAPSLFNRLDFHPNDLDTLHLNVQAARSGFDVPNTFDQLAQTQHQHIATFNVAPGYSRVIGSKALFTANGFVRQDHLTYQPSADPFADHAGQRQPGSDADELRRQSRRGVHAGAHNVKLGGTASATRSRRTSRWASRIRPIRRSPVLTARSIRRSRRSF